MKLNFRQGIVRFQTDIVNSPTFLILTGTGVTLNVSPDSTILAFADGNSDYLFEENQTIVDAWPGPFNPVDQWLYWDVDNLTGERTFGITFRAPTFGTIQPNGVLDDHWFNTITKKMMVYNGTRFIEKNRLFAAKLDDGGILIPYGIGSQVGLHNSVRAGLILFDEDNHPVKKFDRFGRGDFITSESPLASQQSRLANFKLENSLRDAKAVEFIPAYFCVSYVGSDQIGLASNELSNFPCIGISSEDMSIGEVRTFITNGYIKNEAWNWSAPASTKLFVGPTGEITTNVPQSFSIQSIGHIVSPTTILVNIQHLIKLS